MTGGGKDLTFPVAYGPYQLTERLGSGGSSEAYRARLVGAAGFEKWVVLKRLRPGSDQSAEDAFVSEARLAAEIQHPNIVEVLELGQLDNGELYMALEHAGLDLNRILRSAAREQTRLPTWLSLHLAIQILEALAYAHALADPYGRTRNVVHCDVTPDNIYVSSRGEVKLGDFGVATDDHRPYDPYTGQARGKIPYMAPEQLSGERPDQRADVFSLAVVLWECLTQRRLFTAPTQSETISRVCAARRIPPSRYAGDLPAGLDQVLLAALEADKNRRTPSAKHLQGQLYALLGSLRSRVSGNDVTLAMGALINAEPKRAPVVEAPSTDDGLTYSIVKPAHAVERIPMPGGPSHVETADVLKPSSGEQLPMPGRAGDVETRDLLTPKVTLPPPVVATTPLGDRGIWIRRVDGEMGPLTPSQAIEILHSHPEDERIALSLTTDGHRWVSYVDLCRLFGEDRPDPEATLHQQPISGTLDHRSLVSIFGEIARLGASGRLVLLRSDGARLDRRELHIDRGHLVRVTSNRTALRIFVDLQAGHPAERAQLEQLIYRSIDEQSPLESLMPSGLVQRAKVARARIQQKSLEEVFGWPTAAFAFEHGAAISKALPQPLPLLRLLPGLVQQGRSTMMLLESLRPVMGACLERSHNFGAEVAALRLPESESERLTPLGTTPTLDMAIRLSSAQRDEKPSLVLAYLLVELGLLKVNHTQSTPRR